MSIERSGTASSPKAVAGAESHKGKGKATSGDEADALAGGGFLALLTSFESEAAVGVGGAGPANQSESVDTTQLLTQETPQVAVLPSSDPSTLLAQNLPNDLATLLAQAGEVAVNKLSTSSDEPPVRVIGKAVALNAAADESSSSTLLAQNLPNDLAMLLAQAGEVAANKLSTSSDERPVEAKGGIRLAAPVMGADKSEVSIVASAPLGAEKPGDFKQSVDALLDQMSQGLPALTHKARGVELQSGAGASLAEAHAIKLSSLLDVSARESALSGALVTSGMGDSFLRQADRAVAKSSAPPSGYGVEGPWGQHTLLAGSRVDAPSAMTDPAMLPLESMVADTVSYWVTQGVQNAQLKLDGFGGQPVEVSISLKGDEAHIDFRTDQPEIRQILEGAVAHLKDLLTSEGLVLSGVSVGASGQDGSGAQEQRNRPGARQASITTTDVVPTENIQRVNQSGGRAVDLFV